MAQKKKNTPLSSLMKAFATAGHFPSLQPAAFRQELANFKERTRKTIKVLGIEEDITRPPVWTDRNADLKKQIEDANDTVGFFMVVRDIILYTWYQNKIVYTFNQDTVDYMFQNFRPEILQFEMNPILIHICKDPIYLEFPDDSSISGSFCGITSITNRAAANNPDGPLVPITSHISISLTEDGVMCEGRATGNTMVEDYMKDEDLSYARRLILMSLLYIFFLQSRQDADGVALIPKTRQDATCWDVRPIPFPEALPNPGDKHGSIGAGLSYYLRYLSRKNMIRDLQNDLKETEDARIINLNNVAEDSPACNRKFAEMVLDWESYRVVFQYDTKTESTLHDKYFETILQEGINANLLRYLPQTTIVLHQKDAGIVTLVSTCQIQGGTSDGIFWVCINNGIEVGAIPTGPVKFNNVFISFALAQYAAQAAVCALLHILTIYEARALKKIVKDVLTAGDPSSTALTKYQQKPKTAQQMVDASEKPAPEYRIAGDLEYTPFELFDLTGKTMKRVRQTERLAKAGWKMPPHTRRPHPHRYWVGSGENKHLEIRWLERMQIHKDMSVETTTLHNVK